MKHISFALLFATVSTLCMAQLTQTYVSDDALFQEAIELYQQQQYSASYRAFNNYLNQLPANVNTHRAESEYFMTACAYELRHSDALSRLQAYIRQQPYSTYTSETQFMIGVLQTERTKYKPAFRAFDKVKKNELSKRHQSDFLFHCGYANLQSNNISKALENFSELTKQESRYDVFAKYYCGYCHYKSQHYNKALPIFLSIEQTPTYQNIVPYYIIQIYYAQQEYDKIFERAETLLENNPDNENNGEVHRILGEIYYQKADYRQAIAHLSTYENGNKQLIRNDIYLLGLSYYQTQDYANAIKYLSKVTTKKDEMTENAYLHIGNANIKLNDKNNARLAFGAAIATNFDESVHEEVMFNYALTTYETAGAFGESITAFTDFLNLYPNSKYATQSYEIMTDVFMSSKNYQAAYNALLAIPNPTSRMLEIKEYLLYQMGTDAFTQNKTTQAIENFTQVLDLKSQKYTTECYFWRAESYYKIKDYDRCIADLNAFFDQKDATRSKNYVLANYSAGYAYFSQKQYAQAQQYFLTYTAKCKEPNTNYIDAFNRIADCYFYARNFSQAEIYYAKVIAMHSTGADYATFQRGYVLGLQKQYDNKINTLEGLVKQYPKSDFADDALYEIARANLMKEENEAAILSYERLLKTYPNSNKVRKAALEIGMVHFNMKAYDKAIEAYKKVVTAYPGSEESYSALEGLESAYIEANRVNDYLAYVKSIGRSNTNTTSKEDSITYIAAERQYMLGNYSQATAGLSTYISNYCTGGRYCTMAQYYLADSHYKLQQNNEALKAYRALTEISGNPYMEEACIRCAEITYDQKNYQTSLAYFKKLQTVAGTIENINIARLGILRCSYFLNDHTNTINIATQIIDDVRSEQMVITEARYNRAKALLAQQYYTQAIDDLKPLAEELRTEVGAESKYLLANVYFLQNNLDKSETEIMDFANKNTQHQFWLARSFVLLADIHINRGDDFQAKQYLLSVQSNYKTQDEIHTLINERLEQISEREKEQIN